MVFDELEKWHGTYDAISLLSYVIMPNHLHIILFISADELGRTQFAPTVSRMVKQFKGAITKQIGYSIWQKSFMEHIIRNRKEFDAISKYIQENPIKLCYSELYE